MIRPYYFNARDVPMRTPVDIERKLRAENDRLRTLNAELLEALKKLMKLPVAQGQLKILDRGIGTSTYNKAWLEARTAIAKAEAGK